MATTTQKKTKLSIGKVNTISQPSILEKGKDLKNSSISEEKILLDSLQILLRFYGIERSHASIRDIADITDGPFDYRDAVTALENMEFSANVGNLKASQLTQGHCPLIIEFKDKTKAVLKSIDRKKKYEIYDEDKEDKITSYTYSEFKKIFSGGVLIAKSRRQQKEVEKIKKVDWFWSSLSQSKWTYIQVIIAAAVSNFLGLSTSLFIMVVYDRVVPNQAIESLIALTIGVIIALGFDFLIKTLRANFIDRAGKRADIRMSKIIFNQLMTMNLASRSDRSGALASTVRDFESLRDFFTSATLVAIVDLPIF